MGDLRGGGVYHVALEAPLLTATLLLLLNSAQTIEPTAPPPEPPAGAEAPAPAVPEQPPEPAVAPATPPDEPPPRRDDPPPHQEPPRPPEPPPQLGAPFQHTGFHFRGLVGPGYSSATASIVGMDLGVSGVSLGFDVALGTSIADNTVIYFEVARDFTLSPSASVNGSDVGASNVSTNLSTLGLGVAYYFMPTNAYLSFSFALSQLAVEVNSGVSATTKWGPGVSVAVGREWWVANNLGMGVAAHLVVASVPDRGTAAPNWTVWSLVVGPSMTANVPYVSGVVRP
jgi:hypothetical protein